MELYQNKMLGRHGNCIYCTDVNHIIKECPRWEYVRNRYFTINWDEKSFEDLLNDYNSTAGI